MQLNDQGHTAAGHCRSQIPQLDHGRLTMTEQWRWESQPGSGTSHVEEVTGDGTP